MNLPTKAELCKTKKEHMGGDPNCRSLTPYLNTSGANVWAQDFFLPPSLSLYHSIACFFGLERENVKRSYEKESVGFF